MRCWKLIETLEQLVFTRQIRDEKDTKTIYEFLEDRDPFCLDDRILRSLYTGEEASENVNVDDAPRIGLNVMLKMIGKDISAHSFENANKAVTMGSTDAILIDGKVAHIDPQLLFQKLMLMARNLSDDNMKNVFKHELSQRPSSLFDDAGFMREAKTNEFVKQFIAGPPLSNKRMLSDLESISQYVLCGNSFLNRFVWKKNQTYHDICVMYVEYAKKFNNPTIIFESVKDGTIMDEFNYRRSKGVRGVNIKFSGDTVFNTKKEHFLANTWNRSSFMTMLSSELTESGCTVLQSGADHNITIARTATRMAQTNPIIVIADDMEILMMSCYCFDADGYDIILRYDDVPNKAPVHYSIQSIREKHSQQVVDNILFIHSIGGSKATSHIHSIGKGQPLKKFDKSTEFRSIADIFSSRSSTIAEIIEGGTKALTILYDGKTNETIDLLRFKQFSKKVSTKKSAVLVNSLPPTTGAAKYHALRVYCQVQQWMGNHDLNPEEFGWQRKSHNSCRLTPITTDIDPAPPELLSKIRCQCKGNCSTLKCGCFKNQVKCSSACVVCCGSDCLNVETICETEDKIENDECLI